MQRKYIKRLQAKAILAVLAVGLLMPHATDNTYAIEAGLRSETIVQSDHAQRVPNGTAGGGLIRLEGLQGESAVQLVENGDFHNGTTSWNPIQSCTLSISNDGMLVQNDGSSVQSTVIQKLNPVPVGTKLFLYGRVKMTGNGQTSGITMRLYDGQSYLDGGNQRSPKADKWYELAGSVEITNNKKLEVQLVENHYQYAYDNQTMVIDKSAGILCIPMVGDMATYTDERMLELVHSGYWEGIKSVENPTLISRGANIADTSQIEIGALSLNGAPYHASTIFRTGFIPVEEASVYVRPLLGDATYVTNGTRCYDSAHRFIGSGPLGDTLTLVPGTKFVRLTGRRVDSAALSQNDIQQIRKKYQLSETSAYTPYAHDEMTIEGTFRKLPNGVSDGVEWNEDCSAYRKVQRVEKHVLTQDDIYWLNEKPIVVDTVYIIPLPGQVSFQGTGIWEGSALVPVGIEVPWGTNEAPYYSYITNAATNSLGFNYPKDLYTSLEQAKDALAGVEVIYQLAEPVYGPWQVVSLGSYASGDITLLSSNGMKPTIEYTVPLDQAALLHDKDTLIKQGKRINVNQEIAIKGLQDQVEQILEMLNSAGQVNVEFEYDENGNVISSQN